MKYIENSAKIRMDIDKSKQRCLVRNKFKHRGEYKIRKSPTPLGKIPIVL
jgi:hypothetical protein